MRIKLPFAILIAGASLFGAEKASEKPDEVQKRLEAQRAKVLRRVARAGIARERGAVRSAVAEQAGAFVGDTIVRAVEAHRARKAAALVDNGEEQRNAAAADLFLERERQKQRERDAEAARLIEARASSF